MTIVGFVDDSTTISAAQTGPSLNELLHSQPDAQVWNDICLQVEAD